MKHFGFLILFVSKLASAAPSPLSWDEIRSIARERNASLSAAVKTVEASQKGVKAKFGEFLPKFSLNADQSHSTTEISSLKKTTTDLRLGATASWNLFNGFSSLSSWTKAKANAAESSANLDLTSASLRRDLRLAFFRIAVLQDKIRLLEKDLKRVQQNAKLVELKYNSGSEARWNLRTTKAEVARAESDLANSKVQLLAAREALASLLELEDLPDRPVSAPDPSALQIQKLETDSASHPQVLKDRYAAAAAREDIRLARSGYFPSLDLSLSRNFTDARPDGAAASKTNVNAIALAATWNLFNGSIDHFKLQQAGLLHEAAELSAARTIRKVTSTIRSREADLNNALAKLPANRAIREAAEEREKTVSEQYRSGLKSYLDWEQAESSLLNAEQLEINSINDVFNAFAELELAQGLTLEKP